jgi:putative serine protease PepD
LIRGSADGPGVIKNSPADKAGILAEDIIISLNGEKITAEKTLSQMIQKFGVGDTVTLKIKRGDKTMDVQLKLEERPEA